MATKAEIKNAILEVAGYPESGAIFALADKMAQAIVGLDTVEPVAETPKVAASFERPAKENRVTRPTEKR